MEIKQQKKILGIVVVALVLITVLVVFQNKTEFKPISSEDTAKEAQGFVQCLDPQIAYPKINSGKCVPVYEDPECLRSGKVEIRC